MSLGMDIHDTSAYKRATAAPSESVCDDPRHDEHCDCGATPDEDYEAYMEDRR